MKNPKIAKVLNQLADYMDLVGENQFKVGAYRKAARAVENSRQPVAEMVDQLEELPGVGKATAGVIKEIIDTGTVSMLEDLKEILPPELPNLLQLPGLGAKTIHRLYKTLHITNIHELQQAAEEQKIRVLSGFGPKKEEKILEAILQLHSRPERFHLDDAEMVSTVILSELKKLEGIQEIEQAGSLRRRKETIKDLDFVVATDQPIEVAEQIVQLPLVKEVINHGETKVSIMVEVEEVTMSVDIRLVSKEQFASALHHFTGSKEHNVRVRQRAKELGWKVSEYGIQDQKGEMMTFSSEEEFFHKLGFVYILPELREDRGEIELGLMDQIPKLVQMSDYRGDLHMHTLYSDGAHSIYEMAQYAMEKGYEYIAITDHSQSLKVASGLTIAELLEQWNEIDRVQQDLPGITILKGTEMDILADGTLDYPDEILAEMDFVIASVHTNFRQDEQTMTKRIIHAMENPYVDMIGHPTGRKLLSRDPYAVDLDAIFRVAKDTGTILEINANPYRLDLSDENILRAKDYGVRFSINTDAHAREGMEYIRFGMDTARRGWLQKVDVVNTYSWDELRKVLKRNKAKK